MFKVAATALSYVLVATGSGTTPALPRFASGPLSTANYSEAAETGGMVVLSGQIGAPPGKAAMAGFDAQARQAMDNIVAILERRGLTTASIFKCTVMLTDLARWPDFNVIYRGYFRGSQLPTRTAFGVAGLPLNAEVEVECWASR